MTKSNLTMGQERAGLGIVSTNTSFLSSSRPPSTSIFLQASHRYRLTYLTRHTMSSRWRNIYSFWSQHTHLLASGPIPCYTVSACRGSDAGSTESLETTREAVDVVSQYENLRTSIFTHTPSLPPAFLSFAAAKIWYMLEEKQQFNYLQCTVRVRQPLLRSREKGAGEEDQRGG